MLPGGYKSESIDVQVTDSSIGSGTGGIGTC